APREQHVFLSREGFKRPLSRFQISNIVRAAAARAGIELPVSSHWMRHAHCSHSLAHGAPLQLVSRTLGHSNISTTMRYVHINPKESSSSYVNPIAGADGNAS